MRESNYEKVVRLFSPSVNGESEWIAVERFAEVDLNWSKNGNLRYGVAWGVAEFIWEVKRASHHRSAITHLRTAGLQTKTQVNNTIVPRVRKAFESTNTCAISQVPIPKGRKEIDHRYGNKDHPDYIHLYMPENQKPQDFQALLDVLNSVKRELCNQCRETKIRPAHPTLGFVEGDFTHAERFPCKGCYLAEPERYQALDK